MFDFHIKPTNFKFSTLQPIQYYLQNLNFHYCIHFCKNSRKTNTKFTNCFQIRQHITLIPILTFSTNLFHSHQQKNTNANTRKTKSQDAKKFKLFSLAFAGKVRGKKRRWNVIVPFLALPSLPKGRDRITNNKTCRHLCSKCILLCLFIERLFVSNPVNIYLQITSERNDQWNIK